MAVLKRARLDRGGGDGDGDCDCDAADGDGDSAAVGLKGGSRGGTTASPCCRVGEFLARCSASGDVGVVLTPPP
jgi:hypothetical protein